MQQEKYQHPIHNLESGGTVLVSLPRSQQSTPGLQNFLLFFGIFLVGILPGIAIGLVSSEKKVNEAQDVAKLEQLQRERLQQQINKFCKDFVK